MFKLIIAGGRDFNNYDGMSKCLDRLLKNINDNIEIVCGMARGADRLGERYAKEHGYKVIYMPADWDLYGKSAGFKRNVQMAEYQMMEHDKYLMQELYGKQCQMFNVGAMMPYMDYTPRTLDEILKGAS